MTKTEHLQFLLLMLPTFLLLCAAAVCLADLALPADPAAVAIAPIAPAVEAWDDRPPQ